MTIIDYRNKKYFSKNYICELKNKDKFNLQFTIINKTNKDIVALLIFDMLEADKSSIDNFLEKFEFISSSFFVVSFLNSYLILNDPDIYLKLINLDKYVKNTVINFNISNKLSKIDINLLR